MKRLRRRKTERHSKSPISTMLTRFKLTSLLSSPHSTLRLLSTAVAGVGVPIGPPPIRVALTESAGRGVFATRRIGIGEVIHTAKPVVSHPSLSSVGSVCYYCLRRLRDGGGCGVRFCSEECRSQSKSFLEVEKKVDWSIYHDSCRSYGLKYPLLVKRLACIAIAGGASPDCLDILQPESLSHEAISRVQAEYALLRTALVAANFSEEDLKFLTNQWYVGVLARVRINAFRIKLVPGSFEDILSTAVASVDHEDAVGNAVYILPSFYNHDCDPNANIIWIDNVDAKLKALREIEEGEELRICYIDASMDRDARQNILQHGFGFKCSCHRCESGD